MNRYNEVLKAEDYAEPRCLLCDPPYGTDKSVNPIPQQRVVEKLDEYFGKRDYEGALRHLKYWLGEAELGNDLRGELVIRNEMMGLYRKLNLKEESMQNVQKTLRLLSNLGLEDSLSGATVLLNAATVHSAFEKNEDAVLLFEKTKRIYERDLNGNDGKLGGLYNNMGLALAACGRYGEAYESFQKALGIVKNLPSGKTEEAMTYLNMASATEAEHGLVKADKKIGQYLEWAEACLKDKSVPHGGYFAFVCEKCATVFDYYGWFITAQELKRLSEEIYTRAGT